MSKYPEWWDTTVTIYNKYVDPQTQVISWFRTVIEGAFWQYKRSVAKIGDTTLDTESILCRIREDDLYKYRPIWMALPNDKMSEFYTLSRGDIIVRGEVDEDIDEYTSGERSTDFLEKYKELSECFIIDSVVLNIGKSRVCPHYLVQGI